MNHFGFPLETILIYVAVILLSVIIDLLGARYGQEMTVKPAALWSVFWIGLSMLFYLYLRLRFGTHWSDLFLVGYILEKSLSVDNLIVFMAIFSSFNIRGLLQQHILSFGILGAIVFRILFASVGAALFAMSPWVGMFFAGMVAWTAWKMLTAGAQDDELTDYSHHWSVEWTRRILPVYPRLHGYRFILSARMVKEALRRHPKVEMSAGGAARYYATPALLCLMAVQVTDVMFSFDSVPAVIAVTQEPLLIYGAMIFAVLGLRSLYYVLAALMRYLVHLSKAVVVLLFYIAFKLAVGASTALFGWPGFHIAPTQSLLVALAILGTGVVASLLFPGRGRGEKGAPFS
ncbi:MAG: TerC/Alx family metal homeostasis membrane protein [Magnetococcales bacterium]|nr:TerC/Alx family metal homeostasis membrane protein [Magnetococcales bacterium]